MSKIAIKFFILILTALVLFFFPVCSGLTDNTDFNSKWPKSLERVWIGPDYWANRLQDWKISDGGLECVVSAVNRNIHLLTREIGENKAGFQVSVYLKLLNNKPASGKNMAGFLIGAKGEFDDYRDSAVKGKGIKAGITTAGNLFIGEIKQGNDRTAESKLNPYLDKEIKLCLNAETDGNSYLLNLSVYDAGTDKLVATVQKNSIHPDSLTGNIALISDFRDSDNKNAPSCRFRSFFVSGGKINKHEERAFGPVLFSQYTLSRGIMKMTAQMPPVSEKDGKNVILQVKKNGGSSWKTVGSESVDPLSRTALFRIENWDSQTEIPYRLVYEVFSTGGKMKKYYREGVIRKEPNEKEEIVVAGFTGNNDLGFPNNDLAGYVKYHDPDILFFSGDQIYEGVGGYGYRMEPFEQACYDYLRKWYLYGWAYGDLLRDRPAVSIPDDHDVFHGNVWGNSGKAAGEGKTKSDRQDTGGYLMPPEFVKMVDRTQTSHLPDPYDPAPVKQGIGVYYCEMNYAGISFAILEDRKFKSAPKPMLPKAEIWNGWPQNEKFDAVKDADAPGAVLLGERQLKFLNNWSADWSNNTWMKVVLSQTIFSNVATLPIRARSDAVVPRLRILPPGEYPENDNPVSDMDSNGWPQTGRNKALREMRRGFAFHIAGDQHLGSTIQYGIEDWKDAGFAVCVPAISNIWPRRWCPSIPGENRKDGAPRYAGDYKDGFGNFMTVHAVSNPYFTGKKPSRLYDRATGYGIVRLNRKTRDITIECWPRWVDPAGENAEQYSGWPVKINQMDNYGRKAAAWLPTVEVTGINNPVVQVIDESKNETIYTLRINGSSFRPKVFKTGSYTINVGEKGTDNFKVFNNILSLKENEDKILKAEF